MKLSAEAEYVLQSSPYNGRSLSLCCLHAGMKVNNCLLSDYRESNEGLKEQLPEGIGLMVWDEVFVWISRICLHGEVLIRFSTSRISVSYLRGYLTVNVPPGRQRSKSWESKCD